MTRPRQRPLAPAVEPGDRFGWPAVAIFAAALVVRGVHIWQIRPAPFFTVLMGDSQAYDAWARQIGRGDWLGQDVFYQAPLYPYFLGTIYALVGRDLLAVRLVQALVGSAACVLLALAGWRLFSKPVGVVAGLLLALYGPVIFSDALIQKSVLDVFFVCLTLRLVGSLAAHGETPGNVVSAFRRTQITPVLAATSGQVRLKPDTTEFHRWLLALDASPRARWLALGLALGALSLTRENSLVLVAVVALWLFAQRRSLGRERFKLGGAFALGLSIALLPVAARNAFVGGEFQLTTAQFGPNFYIGNNARADGTYMSLRFGRGDPEYERQDATEIAERAMGRPLTPGEVSRYWTGRALSYIRSQPVDWMRLLARKFALLWNATEVLDTESQATHAERSVVLRLTGAVAHFGVLAPLALVGVWVTWRLRGRLTLVYLMLVAYATSVLMFYVFARYRYPLVPFFILLAAAGLVEARRFLRETPARQIAQGAVGLVAVAAFCNWPLLSEPRMRAISETNLGTALRSQGKLEEAASQYRRALAISPDHAPAHNNLGSLLRAEGRLDEAIEHYRAALRLQPEYPSAHYNLANALLALDRPAEATTHFRRAVALDPAWVNARNNLGIALAAQGHLDEAVKCFQQVLAIQPASAEGHYNLGNVLADLGDAAQAISHFRQALDAKPDYFSAHYDLGRVLLDRGQVAEAATHLRRALQLDPQSVEAHNNLGINLASEGRLDEAIGHFRQALQLRPDFADAQRNLATALAARERVKD